ncbi:MULTISPECIES: LexA family transcriptional regulator [Sphingobacterium]|uniref:LexA family transcriptional regulator n=1 Tax=Sphingobacterium TaxID=28453 RepID=UPI00257D9676|nr:MULTISPECIES: S24 family peptidase [Sphingobacterium]
MNKSLIINQIKSHLNIKTDSDFADFLGVKQPTISAWKSRNTMDYELIITKCKDIDANWLITGSGNMLKERTSIKNEDKLKLDSTPSVDGIPLIPVEAFAGAALNNGYAVDFDAIEERYNVPLFDGKGVDFMMYVRGSSMYPKYRSGDIVACRFVRELLFIQWNKVYIIDSKSQGAMIKRLLPSTNPDHVICRSDNREYIDFEVPLSDIQNIAMVIGCISLE